MTTKNFHSLDSILKALQQNQDPLELLEELNRLESEDSKNTVPDIRRYTARAEIFNRCGFAEDGLNTIYEARNSIPFKLGNAKYFAELSRIASMIHSWRPNSEMCAFELLRSIAELQNDPYDTAPELLNNLLQAGQLACETGRFEDALVMLEPVINSPSISKVIQQKAKLWKFKALNALQKFEIAHECQNNITSKELKTDRLRFLLKLETLKTDIGLGLQTDSVSQSLIEIQSLLPSNNHAFEHIEYDELRIQVDQTLTIDESIALVDKLIYRFEEDRLHAKLASVLLLKSDIASKHGESTIQFESLKRAARIISDNQYNGLRARLLKSSNAENIDGCILSQGLLDGFNQPHRYLKGKTLGMGGQARVFHAIDLFTGKSCAIKEFFKGINLNESPAITELENGLKSSARIAHSNILATRDFYFQGDGLNLVTPLGIGKALNIEDIDKLSKDQRIRLCLKIATLVNSIHVAGIVHADIKPDNILVTDSFETVQILDFGIARLDGVFNIESKIFGTKDYTAPEVLSGEKRTNTAVDVYALGALFGKILNNKKTFLSGLFGKSSIKKFIISMQHEDPKSRPSLKAIITEFENLL